MRSYDILTFDLSTLDTTGPRSYLSRAAGFNKMYSNRFNASTLRCCNTFLFLKLRAHAFFYATTLRCRGTLALLCKSVLRKLFNTFCRNEPFEMATHTALVVSCSL